MKEKNKVNLRIKRLQAEIEVIKAENLLLKAKLRVQKLRTRELRERQKAVNQVTAELKEITK